MSVNLLGEEVPLCLRRSGPQAAQLPYALNKASNPACKNDYFIFRHHCETK